MKQLTRARWRCRRGLLELDIVLQRFMNERYALLCEPELRQFDALLDLSDNDLWDMIKIKTEVSDTRSQSVLQLLRAI
ncbi:MAG: succinate dehydrogenase assembly factor 2 [Nitrosospira sp.]|nr:succinate dehydrogenase assembly factor 2 [Nitrosospira sp.]MDW7643045.1 succinate dehydrogenase assembly factor 2 [Nitrosomonadaceae bacterium]MBI0407403.1 succinate dehydrogenase assembly factor 2 [Nitrosospira sp.]MBI0414409.1 succinate dehydrogenase assembly factor 2 [Nitrosospira sp.]MBI0415720.1 succinate dehydrogenase assembly factor 2 [Nitrosospira sp.]